MTVIATAGHVDHGKSSLIRAITGTDPDRLAEEQRTGMTIDLGFAHATTPNGSTLSFIDVPGHVDFIRTMISGVSGVDVALLVIDANEGWKPQTEEHLGILEVLGVGRGIVAVSKCDKVDDGRRNEVTRLVRERLSNSCVVWDDIVATSVRSGEGLDELVSALERAVTASTTDARSNARLFLDRIFTIRGAGTVVTGTLDGASISVGDTLVLAGSNHEVKVRDIQVHNSSVDTCPPGSRCALNITGIEAGELGRGDALVAPGGWLTTTVFDASFTALPNLARPVTRRGSFILHVGSNSQAATLRVTGAGHIDPGTTGTVRVRFSGALPLTPGDRYLIRDTGIGATIGGGTIADIDPRGRLADATSDASVESIMRGRGFVPVALARLLTGRALDPTIGDWFALPSEMDAVTTALSKRLDGEGSIDTSALAAHEREVIGTIPGVRIDNGVARRGDDDPLMSHPYVEMIRDAGVSTPDAGSLDRNVIRQLVHKGVLFEHDHIAFHVDTLESLRPTLESLWDSDGDGFSVSQLRERLGITRKHAVPLAECLDKIGLTRRTQDRRVRGPRW